MASKLPYFIAFGLFVVGFILTCVSYGTGYWLYSWHPELSKFIRLGLWETCFNGFQLPSDYVGKEYYGCWWIFHKEYYYIRRWIMPPWFIAIQTMMTFAFVGGIITVALFPLSAKERSIRAQGILCCMISFCTACLTISVVMFPVMIGEDRTWMPRPDINRTSWSFGLAVIAGFLSAFSLISMIIYTLINRWDRARDEEDKAKMSKMMPMVAKSI